MALNSVTSNERGVSKQLKTVLTFWRSIIIVLTPLLLLPLLTNIGTTEAKCGFVILMMATYWVTEVVPLPVTALLPVILLPLLGGMSQCFKIILMKDELCINNTTCRCHDHWRCLYQISEGVQHDVYWRCHGRHSCGTLQPSQENSSQSSASFWDKSAFV